MPAELRTCRIKRGFQHTDVRSYGGKSCIQVLMPWIRHQIIIDGQRRTPVAVKASVKMEILGGAAVGSP
ncbi:hypothetical protein [Sphaerisporangium siamense]|uniref:Uncharacterized protein n=1 Tax=Sphaerisporangium siamense TaxID=795645 RepID=A0A7W7D9N0_9ACTN|nr:hypothetical protein [Sphaerisporangium siamense]MBB4702838.1 hypothetical protein [Sphaerisporangium siamense]